MHLSGERLIQSVDDEHAATPVRAVLVHRRPCFWSFWFNESILVSLMRTNCSSFFIFSDIIATISRSSEIVCSFSTRSSVSTSCWYFSTLAAWSPPDLAGFLLGL